MTAEIAILNRMGVALAADSAVSIGSSGKVYNSANKLFALSKKHPVGIMIYGNAHFMSVPWEIIIKHYRANELSNTSFASLKSYADSFLKFLAETKILPKDDETEYVESYALRACLQIEKSVTEGMKQYFQKHKVTTQKLVILREMRRLVAHWITQETAIKRKNLPFTALEKKSLIKTHKVTIDNALADFFSNQLKLPLPNTTRQKIASVVFDRLLSTINCLSPTGIVIAGFGDKDIFPSTYQVSIEGRFFSISKLKIIQKNTQEISGKNPASIAPFAQREMVDTFMCGIDPQYKKAVNENLNKEFLDISANVLPNIGLNLTAVQKTALGIELEKRSAALLRACQQVEHKNFVQPVLNSVAALPLDELAAMAEALVNLTSFKRRVTIVPESVGGPIDVAVISKGDGFIWINRKHYFKPDLNHHFFQR